MKSKEIRKLSKILDKFEVPYETKELKDIAGNPFIMLYYPCRLGCFLSVSDSPYKGRVHVTEGAGANLKVYQCRGVRGVADRIRRLHESGLTEVWLKKFESEDE